MLDSELHSISSRVSRRWGLFLISAFAWLLIAVVLLRFNATSVATIGLMLGAVFLFAAVHQFAVAVVQGGGLTAIHHGSSHPAGHLGRLLRHLPRHQRSRHRSRDAIRRLT